MIIFVFRWIQIGSGSKILVKRSAWLDPATGSVARSRIKPVARSRTPKTSTRTWAKRGSFRLTLRSESNRVWVHFSKETREQCDQIGLLLKSLSNTFSYRSSPNIWHLLGLFKTSLFNLKLWRHLVTLL